jgi:predicted  nucleic acid-binding Zn-ribbon protein
MINDLEQIKAYNNDLSILVTQLNDLNREIVRVLYAHNKIMDVETTKQLFKIGKEIKKFTEEI